MVVGPDNYLRRPAKAETVAVAGQRLTRREDPQTQTRRQACAGNPFDNEVFSYGHRNVQGLAFDDQGRLWASEFGQQAWDELNLIREGANYGWPEVEGSGGVEGMTNPKVVWRTRDASLPGWRTGRAICGWRDCAGNASGKFRLTARRRAIRSRTSGRLRPATVWSSPTMNNLLSNSNTDGRGDPSGDDDRLFQ